FAVPPVESIVTPSSCSPRASALSPRLSETLSKARFTLGIELLHMHTRHALADRGEHLVGDAVAPAGDVVRRDGARAEHRHDLPRDHARDVGDVEHDVVHADAAYDRDAAAAHHHGAAVGGGAVIAAGVPEWQRRDG